MKTDTIPILEEAWRVKDELARDCGYDVDRMFDAFNSLTAQEEKKGRHIIRSYLLVALSEAMLEFREDP